MNTIKRVSPAFMLCCLSGCSYSGYTNYPASFSDLNLAGSGQLIGSFVLMGIGVLCLLGAAGAASDGDGGPAFGLVLVAIILGLTGFAVMPRHPLASSKPGPTVRTSVPAAESTLPKTREEQTLEAARDALEQLTAWEQRVQTAIESSDKEVTRYQDVPGKTVDEDLEKDRKGILAALEKELVGYRTQLKVIGRAKQRFEFKIGQLERSIKLKAPDGSRIADAVAGWNDQLKQAVAAAGTDKNKADSILNIFLKDENLEGGATPEPPPAAKKAANS